MLKKVRWVFVASMLCLFSGCMDISPFSPEMDQRIDNQNGRIDDIRNNQSGVMAEIGKLQNKLDVQARDIGNLQSGLINQSNQNSGVQILQGDGGLVVVFSLATIAMLLIFHYRSKYKKSDQAASLLAQQVAIFDSIDLENEIFLAAMHTPVEEEIYHLIVNHQKQRQRP